MQRLKSPIGLRFTYNPKSNSRLKTLFNAGAEKIHIDGATFLIKNIYCEHCVHLGGPTTNEYFVLSVPEISTLDFYVDASILNELLSES